jgi:hypothetical protein
MMELCSIHATHSRQSIIHERSEYMIDSSDSETSAKHEIESERSEQVSDMMSVANMERTWCRDTSAQHE